MFRNYAQHFASWGILYDLISNKTDPPRLNILTLPPGISERCKTEPKLIMELLRGEIYALAETGSTRSRPADVELADTKHAWLRRMGSCPKGILHLLNSRACRSAIMFNDRLSLEQCQNLVRKVAGCAFPFMCAHGRNSMVPLVYLDGDGGDVEGSLNGFGETAEQGKSFGEAYKKWRKEKN